MILASEPRADFAEVFVVPTSSSGSHARLLGKVRVKDDKVTFVASGVDLTTKSR